ncbi:MAG: hypothetical protein WBA41_21415 [Rivularia sp. (in: cyanobacteria)]
MQEENNKIVFRISSSQQKIAAQWMTELDERIARNQLETGLRVNGSPIDERRKKRIKDSLEKGDPRPDYGAIGGVYTHIFRDTLNGLIHELENGLTHEKINLTQTNTIETNFIIGIIEDVELEKLKQWQDSIEEKLGNQPSYMYEITSTSVGSIKKVTCLEANEKIDITEYRDF